MLSNIFIVDRKRAHTSPLPVTGLQKYVEQWKVERAIRNADELTACVESMRADGLKSKQADGLYGVHVS